MASRSSTNEHGRSVGSSTHAKFCERSFVPGLTPGVRKWDHRVFAVAAIFSFRAMHLQRAYDAHMWECVVQHRLSRRQSSAILRGVDLWGGSVPCKVVKVLRTTGYAIGRLEIVPNGSPKYRWVQYLAWVTQPSHPIPGYRVVRSRGVWAKPRFLAMQ